jgi:hypothetical protein
MREAKAIDKIIPGVVSFSASSSIVPETQPYYSPSAP